MYFRPRGRSGQSSQFAAAGSRVWRSLMGTFACWNILVLLLFGHGLGIRVSHHHLFLAIGL